MTQASNCCHLYVYNVTFASTTAALSANLAGGGHLFMNGQWSFRMHSMTTNALVTNEMRIA